MREKEGARGLLASKMTLPLTLISDSRKPMPAHQGKRRSLLLSGLTRNYFSRNGGEPDTQLGLNQLGTFYELGPMFLIVNPEKESHHSVWIYKKRDTILFITKKRLPLDFKWSDFRVNLRSIQKKSPLLRRNFNHPLSLKRWPLWPNLF